MVHELINYLQELGLSNFIIVFIISMLPIVELRGAIPVGILIFAKPYLPIIITCLIGNMLPVPFLLLFFDFFTKLMNKWKFTKSIMDWVFKRTRKKTKLIEKYEFWGLVLLVAIPLPFTGAWTGVVAAYITGLKFKRAFTAIFIGVLIAGTIVSALSILIHMGLMKDSGIFLKY
ncbi:small multi-drug export protein [Candidatus Dependentiae bacterium]|nr:small multi-drug export protein [Candidatus Dependentiae bacterium]